MGPLGSGTAAGRARQRGYAADGAGIQPDSAPGGRAGAGAAPSEAATVAYPATPGSDNGSTQHPRPESPRWRVAPPPGPPPAPPGQQSPPSTGPDVPAPSVGSRHAEPAARHDPGDGSEVTSLINRDQLFPGTAGFRRREGSSDPRPESGAHATPQERSRQPDGEGTPPLSGPQHQYAPPADSWAGEDPAAPEPSPQGAGAAEPSQGWNAAPAPSPEWRDAPERSEAGQQGRGPQSQPRPPQQEPAADWAAGPTWDQAQGSAADFSYVNNIRRSEMVPTRKIPPRRGWRKAVYAGTFHLINLGRSPDERRQAELEAKIRSLLRGKYKIGVLGKGGVGKTTMAACLGSIFAELRPDDRVVAIDADTAFGKLASRIDPQTSGSYWELAGDRHLHTFADVRSRVGSNASGLFVLGGEVSTARRRVLDPAVYRAATAQLDKHFTLSIVDLGSSVDAPVTRAVVADLDALIVVSSCWYDGASAAGQTLEWLANNGYTGLLHRTAVVVNNSDNQASKRDVKLLVERFGSRGQKVIEMPYDRHLRPAGVVDVTNEVDKLTRRRLLELAADLAEHFAATTDRPRARR